MPGATHGGDESWLFDSMQTKSPGELALSRDMALWWASMARPAYPVCAARPGLNAAGQPRLTLLVLLRQESA